LNTLRIFLWYEPLFTCQPEDAIPNEAALTKVDQLLALAQERNLKVIVTLNDLPDLIFRPLYTDWGHYDNQTIYIVRRYRNHPAILAWDVRNEGDIDYGAQSPADAKFGQAEVVNWVEHITQLVRAHDPDHLITAGWWSNPTATAPYVDFLSFHYWTDDKDLAELIKSYRQGSRGKPLLLGEFGYSSWAESPPDAAQEGTQAEQLDRVIRVVKKESLAGWLAWTAFDFVPAPGQPPHQEHFFGLWRVDLSQKPVVKLLGE
jgi:endo-1,4-beta-mannosidase